jgi:anti-anti-sigma factor
MKAEFTISKNPSGDELLSIKGDLTVQHSGELKEWLCRLGTIGSADFTFSLKEVTSIDVSGLQLIYAAAQSQKAGKKKMSIVWPEDQAVNSLIANSGFKYLL